MAWSLGLLLFPLMGMAQPGPSTAPDKSGFHLFNPTPRDVMRELSTDRPDKTESAYTVDAGHFQLEMDVMSVARDLDQGTRVDEWGFANMNLKVGLLNQVDLQIVVPAHQRVRTRTAAGSTTDSGVGDLSTRIKINLWGNDGGKTAFAIMPFARWPTASSSLAAHRSVEGGFINLLAVELPADFSLGLMSEFDFVRSAGPSGYDTEFVHTITVGHDIWGKLAGYVEFWSLVGTHGGDWQGTLDLGVTYSVSRDLQLDLGINLGVTRSAPDYQPFIGVSWRY